MLLKLGTQTSFGQGMIRYIYFQLPGLNGLVTGGGQMSHFSLWAKLFIAYFNNVFDVDHFLTIELKSSHVNFVYCIP